MRTPLVISLPKEEQGTLKIRIGMQSTASLPTIDEVCVGPNWGLGVIGVLNTLYKYTLTMY